MAMMNAQAGGGAGANRMASFGKSRAMQDALKLRAFSGTWPRPESARLAAADWTVLGLAALATLIIACVSILLP